MENSLAGQLLLQVLLIALNAVFACAEIAVISMSPSRLEQLKEQGNKKAVRLAKLTEQPAKFLATIQVAITLAGFLASAFAADSFSKLLVDGFLAAGVPVSASTLHTISLVLITLVLSYFTLVFGELVPKRLAMKQTENIALSLAGMLGFVAALFKPVVWLLTVSTNGILRLFGVDPNAEEEEVSEEEIRMMADAGSKKGVIDLEENEIIQNLFEFDDLTVGEFATHRTDIALLWMDETLEQWEQTIHESRHSMYPVCDETVDNVMGVLNVKDFFRYRDRTKEFIVKHEVKPAQFIPESVRADVLFRRMKASRNHFAVVLDEYGGMVGIVTMNDLLEQLVGDLEDDLTEAAEEPKIEQLDSSTWRIDGGVDLEDAQEKLGVELPVEDYDTFGGFVFGVYGSIPSDGTRFELDTHNLHIKVLSIKEHRLVRALVCRLETEEESFDESEKEGFGEK